MHRPIRLLVAAALAVSLAVVGLVLVGRTVSAEHTDLITEPIPTDDAVLHLELVGSGMQTPLWGASAAYDTDTLYVADQVGTVTALPTGGEEESYLFLDVGPSGADLMVRLKTEGADERGLLGFAFDPHYRKNGLVYTYLSEPLGPAPDFSTLAADDPREPDASLSVIRQWRVDDPRDPNATVEPDSSRVLLRIEQPQVNHNAGAIVFGPDAMLYVALGDGGKRDDEGPGHAPDGNGQDLSDGNVLGKILRIDPHGSDSANGAYGIPADNPFVDGPGADEVFAYGFRNPFRMSFDPPTGDLYVADVGQADVEEVSIVRSGGNYGWPVKEGTFLFESNGPDERGAAGDNSPGEPPGMIDPIVQYDHDEGSSVTGGFVYHGTDLPDLVGSYVFGDFSFDGGPPGGRLFRLAPDGRLSELVPTNIDTTRLMITGFGRDTEGELYVMGISTAGAPGPGVVYRLGP